MIGWKVVSPGEEKGTFRSAITCIMARAWIRTYALGQRTVGYGGTPVLAFRTRQAARDFYVDIPGYYRIFKARLENPRPQPRIATPLIGGAYEAFWGGSPKYGVDAPEGTLACDAITLLEPA